MVLKVLPESWRDQYDRMLRSSWRFSHGFPTTVDYDDAFYHFLQDAWHLKDWISNDPSLDQTLKSCVVAEAERSRPLRVVADLANGTKHLVLTRYIREGASVSSMDVTVLLGQGRIRREIVVTLIDGTQLVGANIVSDAVAEWDRLLHKCGLSTT
jgi:hypothetical protein